MNLKIKWPITFFSLFVCSSMSGFKIKSSIPKDHMITLEFYNASEEFIKTFMFDGENNGEDIHDDSILNNKTFALIKINIAFSRWFGLSFGETVIKLPNINITNTSVIEIYKDILGYKAKVYDNKQESDEIIPLLNNGKNPKYL